MQKKPTSQKTTSEFMEFLASLPQGEIDRIPPLRELSIKFGVSISTLREQMEVARAFGLIEVKPKTGIKRLPYQFEPAIIESLSYATKLEPENFQKFSDLRNHIETAYWFEAVSLLTVNDHERLYSLINSAWVKLHSQNPQIPQEEHRELHVGIYRNLDNLFVTGLLEAYWEIYEISGFSYYFDIKYLEIVWKYHEKMVNAVISGDYETGYKALTEHMTLLNQRTPHTSGLAFE